MMAGVISILWIEAYRHYLPPAISATSFRQGELIAFDSMGIVDGQTKYIHFFDGSCLYSRTNIDHLSLFIHQYREKCAFYILVTDDIDPEAFRKEYSLPSFVHVVPNVSREVFTQYGVTATPHAMITLDDNTLYFQGNYTLNNGLCGATNINQSAPAIALRFVSNNKPSPLFPQYQQSNWGCHL